MRLRFLSRDHFKAVHTLSSLNITFKNYWGQIIIADAKYMLYAFLSKLKSKLFYNIAHWVSGKALSDQVKKNQSTSNWQNQSKTNAVKYHLWHSLQIPPLWSIFSQDGIHCTVYYFSPSLSDRPFDVILQVPRRLPLICARAVFWWIPCP